MKQLLTPLKLLFVITFLLLVQVAESQFLMDMIDTSKSVAKGILDIYSRYDRLRFSGYIQPQFQVSQSKGARTFEGGDFATNSNDRFMLRRSRIRLDYVRSNQYQQPSMQFVFQIDATERGVNVRDAWIRLFENKWRQFAFTTGVFARPFGYEVNLASSDRESPERGRMSQTLMKTERDLGAMVSFESRNPASRFRFFKIDLGVFNGQGLNGPGEFDQYKDYIGRIALKPYPINKSVFVSAGFSYLNGGILQSNKYRYRVAKGAAGETFEVDSSLSNVGTKNPRKYYGFDAQVKLKHQWGFTEIRGEYWWGTQTSSAATSETPGVLLGATEGYYIRPFNGAFIYFLQNIVNTHHQLAFKLDWYDPNTKVSGKDIGKAGTSVNATNIKYTNYGVGYNYYINENVKLLLWYHFVNNEKTNLTGYTTDLADNIFTCRMQYRF